MVSPSREPLFGSPSREHLFLPPISALFMTRPSFLLVARSRLNCPSRTGDARHERWQSQVPTRLPGSLLASLASGWQVQHGPGVSARIAAERDTAEAYEVADPARP
jgi:hypothetical protein